MYSLLRTVICSGSTAKDVVIGENAALDLLCTAVSARAGARPLADFTSGEGVRKIFYVGGSVVSTGFQGLTFRYISWCVRACKATVIVAAVGLASKSIDRYYLRSRLTNF